MNEWEVELQAQIIWKTTVKARDRKDAIKKAKKQIEEQHNVRFIVSTYADKSE